MKLLIRPFIIFVLSIAADQITKMYAMKNLVYNQPVEVLGSFFRFTLVHNEGGAMGTNFGSSVYYLIAASLILLFVIYYIYINRSTLILTVPLSFIAGGAVGNIIDRIRFGYVIDFIDVDFFDINILDYRLQRWWTFNIADSVISCSLVFLIVYMLFFNKEKTAIVTDSTALENDHS